MVLSGDKCRLGHAKGVRPNHNGLRFGAGVPRVPRSSRDDPEDAGVFGAAGLRAEQAGPIALTFIIAGMKHCATVPGSRSDKTLRCDHRRFRNADSHSEMLQNAAKC